MMSATVSVEALLQVVVDLITHITGSTMASWNVDSLKMIHFTELV